MQQKTILIVGGAGYIGSHVNKRLHLAGFKTIVLDNLTRGNRDSVIQGQFVLGDTGSLKDLNHIFSTSKIDAVMHFAAHTAVGESVKNPAKYYHNNLINTLLLLETMVRHQVKIFIFSSTAAIFGLPQYNSPIKEDHPCIPINPYGQSKLMVEKILSDFDLAYNMKFCSLRYFNAAGGDPDGQIKHPKREENNIIPLIINNLLKEDASVTVFGNDYNTPDGTCIRDYIHVYDLALAHLSALEKLLNGSPSKSYNLGNGQGFSVMEVIHTIEKVTGHQINIQIGRRRQGDPPILLADSQKAKNELSWKPKFSDLESMIMHAWQAMSTQKSHLYPKL